MSSENILAAIDADKQLLTAAIGEDILTRRGFVIVVDGLAVVAKSAEFKISVHFWHSLNGQSVPAWQAFHYWRRPWSRSSFIEVNGLETVARDDTEGLRAAIELMCSRVEAYLELHPKPPSWLDRLSGIFTGVLNGK
jgi:hypothetical protein